MQGLRPDVVGKHLAHGLCMVFAFGLFYPSSVAIILTWGTVLEFGLWCKLHRALALLGLLFALIGFIIALSMTPPGSHFNHGHEIVGVLVFLLTLMQPLFSLLFGISLRVDAHAPAAQAPADITRVRSLRTVSPFTWNLIHIIGGALLIIGGLYQVASGYVRTRSDSLYGIPFDSEEEPPSSAASTIVLYFIFLAAVLVFLALGLTKSRRRGWCNVALPGPAVAKAVDTPSTPGSNKV